MFYYFLRLFFIPLAFISWVIYSLAIKRKQWAAIKGDVYAGSFFVVAAFSIFYYLSH